MNKRLIATSALVLCGLVPIIAKAQSPWESGTYKDYAPEAPSSETPSTDVQGGSGLEGFSLSPVQQQPIAPTPGNPMQAPATAESIFSKPAVPTFASTSPRVNTQDPAYQKLILPANESAFVAVNLESSQTMLDAAQIAAKNGSKQSKAIAAQVTSFYDPFQAEMRDLADKNNISYNVSPIREQIAMDRLNASPGDFDKQYLRLADRELYKTSSNLNKEATKGDNEALKEFASKHLQDAETLLQSMQQLSAQNMQVATQAQPVTTPQQQRSRSGVPNFSGSPTTP